MRSENSLSLIILGWATVVIAAISMFATPALSQTAFVSCLQAQGNECRLIAPTIGISIGVGDGDAHISYYIPAADGFKVDHVESVGKDMEAQVIAGRMSEDDAAYVFAELLSSRDLRYRLPENAEALKRAVGFDPMGDLSPQDQVDILASHVQMTLGVSALTADYIVMKLGLQIIEPEPVVEPAAVSQPTADAPATDAPTLTANQN